MYGCIFFFFKQKTAYEMRISDWSSDVCSSDLLGRGVVQHNAAVDAREEALGNGRILGDDRLGVVRSVALDMSHGGIRSVDHPDREEIGRASCRERVCQYV